MSDHTDILLQRQTVEILLVVLVKAVAMSDIVDLVMRLQKVCPTLFDVATGYDALQSSRSGTMHQVIQKKNHTHQNLRIGLVHGSHVCEVRRASPPLLPPSSLLLLSSLPSLVMINKR